MVTQISRESQGIYQPDLLALIHITRTISEKKYKQDKAARWNAYLATVNVMNKLLNTRATPSKRVREFDTATFRVADNPFTWIVQVHPLIRHYPVFDVDIRQTQHLRTSEIRLWKIIIRDYVDPSRDWSKSIVESVLAPQSNVPTKHCILLTTSWNVTPSTEKRLAQCGIKLCILYHSPSEKEGLDEMTEILTKYLTRKTIDPTGSLGTKTFLDKWMGKPTERGKIASLARRSSLPQYRLQLD